MARAPPPASVNDRFITTDVRARSRSSQIQSLDVSPTANACILTRPQRRRTIAPAIAGGALVRSEPRLSGFSEVRLFHATKKFLDRRQLYSGAGLLLPIFSSGASPASKRPAAKEKLIYSFQGGADGASPFSDLTLDAAGNLYGTTQWGGTGTACSGGCGTVFELKRTPDGWKKKLLFSFTGGKDGSCPGAGVIFDSSGNLYGTTETGGSRRIRDRL